MKQYLVCAIICFLPQFPLTSTQSFFRFGDGNTGEAERGRDSKTGGGHPEESEILMAQVVFRHGDRTPVFMWRKDPHHWKNSNNSVSQMFQRSGMLTKRGRTQGYELGEVLFNRYKNNLLQNMWIPEDIHCQSSEVERTIMTAQAVLAGLFHPDKCNKSQPGCADMKWNDGIKWSPIPVYAIPKKYDNKIMYRPEACDAYMRALDQVLSCPPMQEYKKLHEKVFCDVQKHTGMEKMDLKNIGLVHDTLFIEKLYNLELPKWTLKYFPDPLKEIHELGFQVISSNRLMMKFFGGPLLGELLTNMRHMVNVRCSSKMQRRLADQGRRNKKLFLYSGHDTTVSGLLATLGLYHPHIPGYAAAVSVELHKSRSRPDKSVCSTCQDADNKYFIKVLYRDGHNSSFKEMPIPGCPSPCTLTQVETFTEDLMTKDWNKDCQAWKRTVFTQLMDACLQFLGKYFLGG